MDMMGSNESKTAWVFERHERLLVLARQCKTGFPPPHLVNFYLFFQALFQPAPPILPRRCG